MGDGVTLLTNSFIEALHRLPPNQQHLLDSLGEADAEESAVRALEAAVAPILWRQAAGETWDTKTTADFLGVTRQALNERVRRATILGLPGRRVTWFPVWQFDIAARQVRPGVPELLKVFADARRPLAAVEIAGWANRPRDDLDGLSPADWLAERRPLGPVLDAARHTVARLDG